MERALGQNLLEVIPHLGGGEGILAVRQDECAGRRCVNIECTIAAPYAVEAGIGQLHFGFGSHVIDDAQLVLGEIERIGRAKRLEAQALALIAYLKEEGKHIARGQAKADDLQERADHLALLFAAEHASKGKDKENEAEDSGRHPAALDAEGIKKGEAPENQRIDFDVGGEYICVHRGLLYDWEEYRDQNDCILT